MQGWLPGGGSATPKRPANPATPKSPKPFFFFFLPSRMGVAEPPPWAKGWFSHPYIIIIFFLDLNFKIKF
jgi:hypothetical protein